MDEYSLLTSLSNPLIKKIRALKRRKARVESGLFMVEGLHHVGSVLEADWEVDALLYAPNLLTGNYAKSLIDNAQRNGLEPKPVSNKVMESLAEKDNPQGILAAVRQRKLGFSELGDIQSGVALVSPQDPGNVGAILRTLDAVNADVLFMLNGGVDLYHPSCVRASMGTIFWKPIVRTGFDEFTVWAKEKGIQLIGTSAHGDKDIWNIQTADSPWLLLLGSEQKGLSAQHLGACDISVSLPMRGKASSLNLSVTAGVLLYALIKK